MARYLFDEALCGHCCAVMKMEHYCLRCKMYDGPPLNSVRWYRILRHIVNLRRAIRKVGVKP